VQKLEEILHAEDSARDALAEAREAAGTIEREAAAEAELARASSKREATVQAAAEHETILSAAREQAEVITATGQRELEQLLRAAEARAGRATEIVARELTG
jgi:vacuolar-type H+-ATPase subunit H